MLFCRCREGVRVELALRLAPGIHGYGPYGVKIGLILPRLFISDRGLRSGVNGRGPRLRRGRDSTDRCVPARSPSVADHERACLLQSQKKSKGPKSPNQRSGALNYTCFYKIKVSKTGRYKIL